MKVVNPGPKTTWGVRALGGLWSAGTAWVLVNEASTTPLGKPSWIAVFLVVALLLAFPASWVLMSAWNWMERHRRVLSLLVCVASGLVLSFAIPMDIDAPIRLQVKATGENDPASLGSAVWVVALTRDGHEVPLSSLELAEGWKHADGAVFATSGESDALTWDGEAARSATVRFSTGTHLGVAQVSWQEETTRVDLYSPNEGEVEISFDPSPFDAHRATLRLAATLLLGLAIFALTAWCMSHRAARHTDRSPTAGRWGWLALATPPALVWTIHLLAYWPGVMTPDSMWQWTQVLTGEYDNWHPAFHTMLQWVLTRPARTPAIVAAAQIAAVSGVVGWALSSMRRLGLPAAAAWLMSSLIALWPPNGILVVTLWKDIPYSIGVLALGVMLLKEVDGRDSVLGTRGGWAIVGGVCGLVALVHHAGPVVAAGSLVALALAGSWKRILAPAAMALIMFALVQGPLFAAAEVVNTSPPHAHAVVVHHLAAHLVEETPLTHDEADQLDDHPFLGDVSWYDCETVTPLVVLPQFSVEELRAGSRQALSLWWALFTRDPGVDMRHTLCRSALMWRIGRLPGTYHYATGLGTDADGRLSTIVDNPHGLALEPVIPSLTEPLTEAIRQSEGFATAWLWWRGPLYLYALLFGAAIAALRSGDWRFWMIPVPAGLVGLTLAVAAQAQDFRYVYPVFLSGLLIAPYLILYASVREGSSREASELPR